MTSQTVNVVTDEVGKIFGKDGKNKLKPLIQDVDVYSVMDNLKKDMEIVADKPEFDEMTAIEDRYFGIFQSFSPDHLVGDMIFSDLGTLQAKSNLATVKAIHGVQHDVYQYEVQLKTNGSSRIGWATENCEFTNNIGIGETINSYGFDGFRSEKWNSSNTTPYGKKWRIGNVIGCVIDFPRQSIEYFRNGQTLGIAFNKIDEADMTFFPALTLSNEEYVSVNLGERPFKFPIPKAKPVIAYPTVIIDYYKRLEINISTFIDRHISLQSNAKNNDNHPNKIIVNNVIGNVLFHQFMGLLKIPYIINYCFVSFLNNLIKKKSNKLKVLLELMWENIPENDMIFIMDHFMFEMLGEYQCTWRKKYDISHQIMVLKLITEICKETNTRKQMIVHILFDKVKFAHFLHILAPSDDIFDHMMPYIYWSIENVDLADDIKKRLIKNFPNDFRLRRAAFNYTCDKIKRLLNEIMKLQVIFLKTLLNDNDQTDSKVSSRILFCRRFQSFIQENMIFWRNDPTLRLPSPVLLSSFFRLSVLLRELWNEELKEEKDVKIHPNIFYLENYNYFGVERVGGLFTHLKMEYRKTINSKLGRPVENPTADKNENSTPDASEDIVEFDSAAGLITVLTRIIGNVNAHGAGTVLDRIFSFDNLPTDKGHILSALLNNIICLYSIAAHKQLIEYISFKDRLTELSLSYALIENEIRESNENRENLQQSLEECKDKIGVTSRHVAWLMSMTFTDTNEQILEWILLTISKTIKHCSETEEELFRFLPEFYIDNMVGLIVLLPDYANKTQQYENIITDNEWLATLIGEILLGFFNDRRIVHPQSKESIIQGITLYFSNPKAVNILQKVSEKSRLHAIKSILQPTDRTLWPQTNLILMLIWYGSGFAFRYTRPPHLENQQMKIRGSIYEIMFSNIGSERPPAYVFQYDIQHVMASDRETASKFINNSLNYLNLAFSEFISTFHEIKNITVNVENPLTQEELNNLRMCSRNFILTATVLRVIEMITYFDRSLIINQEGSLGRVFQLICQILNRVHSSTSTFQHVLSSSLPYIECVHKFLVVVPLIGIILTLLEGELDDPVSDEETVENNSKISSVPEVTDVLISDPNFNLPSFDFISLPANESDEPFSLNSYKNYVSDEELNKAALLYRHLEWCIKRHKSITSSINEDDLCMICYSNKKNVTLKPCEHQCCKSCIVHHILYSAVCFYCKRRIESVVDAEDPSTVLYDFGTEPPPLRTN